MYDITKYRNENILKDSYLFLFQIISFYELSLWIMGV
jgi:hypothetical protein